MVNAPAAATIGSNSVSPANVNFTKRKKKFFSFQNEHFLTAA